MATICCVYANKVRSFTRSAIGGERKLLHILKSIVESPAEQECDTNMHT